LRKYTYSCIIRHIPVPARWERLSIPNIPFS
jgi:hypothetical protein